MTEPLTELPQFQQALRGLAHGVVIVSARSGAERHAMTATAVSSVSFAPPSMLVCVNDAAAIYPGLAAGARFCINILARADEGLARVCSGSPEGAARFASPRWADDAHGVPYLEDVQASIFCTHVQQTRYGTHGIFIGAVTDVRLGTACDPLIYAYGRYAGLTADER